MAELLLSFAFSIGPRLHHSWSIELTVLLRSLESCLLPLLALLDRTQAVVPVPVPAAARRAAAGAVEVAPVEAASLEAAAAAK